MTDTARAQSLTDYAAARDALLERIVRVLSADDRFLASWLVGSLARGQGDAVSDLDLTLVVTDTQRDALCARPWMVGAGTNARRLAVFEMFGEPAVIHEDHHKAPAGGTFTYVLYAGTALPVEWVFVPLSDARRPPGARMLFAKTPIPPSQSAAADTLPRRIDRASERVSFFWMQAAIAARFRARGDVLNFHLAFDRLQSTACEIAALVSGEAAPCPRLEALATTPAAQAEAVRRACAHMLDLMPRVVQLGGHVPPEPMGAIEVLLGLIDGQAK